jgi:hypothetical protein
LLQQFARNGSVFEELPDVVKHEPGVQFQFGDPAGRRLIAVEVDLLRTGGAEIVREALEFERRPTAHGERAFQQGLKRDDDMLPAKSLILVWRWQLGRRATIHTAGNLFEPAMRGVLASKAAGIALALKPIRIDEQPLRKVELQPV